MKAIAPPPAAGAAAAQMLRSKEMSQENAKATRRPRSIAVGAVFGRVALLALGLVVFGLPAASSAEGRVDRVARQAVFNDLGCYRDDKHNRVLTDSVWDPTGMTPMVCNAHCHGGGHVYFAIQSGEECWCAGADVTIDKLGPGICDYECSGDQELTCGGHLSFSAFHVVAGVWETTITTALLGTNAVLPFGQGACQRVADVRFTSTAVYLIGGGCITLGDIYDAQRGGNHGSLYVLDADDNIVSSHPTGRWLLTRDLRIVDGVTLHVHGASVGGDADVLRIKSTGPSDFCDIRAHGGSLSFKSTEVTSWDTDRYQEQTAHEGGRSSIACVSEETSVDSCSGAAENDMGECRMDIIDSTIRNLGWSGGSKGESYGIAWKVRGFCDDLSNPEVFDRTNVYGDIKGSDISGMYIGAHTSGHQGGEWADNKIHGNVLYGFHLDRDSDEVAIVNNEVYGNGYHGIMVSERSDWVTISGNQIYDGGDSTVGIFVHRSSNFAQVYGNDVRNMRNAGMVVLESMDADIHDNVFEDIKFGIRLSAGSSGNRIHDNIFNACSSFCLYMFGGSDVSVSDGRPSKNVFSNNDIYNTETGIVVHDGDNNEFTGNDFTTAKTLEFKDSTSTKWFDNMLPSGACFKDREHFTPDSDSIPLCES